MVKLETFEPDQLSFSEENVRKTEQEIGSLTASIRAVGLIEPVIAVEKEGKTEVLVGQRRVVAAKQAKKKVLAIVYDAKEMTPAKMRMMSLIENEERAPLTDADKQEAIRQLTKDLGTPERVADAIGWTPGKIRKWLGYDGLPEKVKQMMDQGSLTMRDALRLADLMEWRSSEEIIEIAKHAADIPEKRQRGELFRTARFPGVSLQTLKTRKEVIKRQRRLTVSVDVLLLDALAKAVPDLNATDLKDAVAKILQLWLGERGYY